MGDQQTERANGPAAFDAAKLTDLARTLRRDVLKMTTEAGSGHPSSSFSIVEIMATLYFGGILQYDPKNPGWPERDRFILSKGHAAPILYAILAEAGYFPKDELMTLRKYGSALEGHPNMRRLPGVEASTGSLGQGLSIGLGQALAARSSDRLFNVYVITGDGEQEEGQIWEAAMAAANLKAGNLTVIVDNNKFQQTTAVANLTDPSKYPEKWRAFGWKTVEINGHDLNEVHQALTEATNYTDGPFAIIAHTIKGKGLHFMEIDYTWHGKAVPKDKLAAALEEIG